jgi:hypothetical protein
LSELSPARIELLKKALDCEERMLDGCEQFFRGLSHHPDAEVSSVCREVLRLLKNNRDTLEAMVDGLNETFH